MWRVIGVKVCTCLGDSNDCETEGMVPFFYKRYLLQGNATSMLTVENICIRTSQRNKYMLNLLEVPTKFLSNNRLLNFTKKMCVF